MSLIANHSGFDAQYHDYDLEKYPFSEWALRYVQAADYDADDLEKLHEVLLPEDQPSLTKRLIQESGESEFQTMLTGSSMNT